MALPARKTPGVIHAIPLRGAPGAVVLGADTTPPSPARESAAARWHPVAVIATTSTPDWAATRISVALGRPVGGPLAQAELLHLELQALARDLQQARRMGHVAAGLLQRAAHELALEPAHGHLDVLLEPALAGEG